MTAPADEELAALLKDAYRLLREAESHLEARGFTYGTGTDGAFMARSAELRERMSGAVDLRLRRSIELGKAVLP
jgi:hypothetical protein